MVRMCGLNVYCMFPLCFGSILSATINGVQIEEMDIYQNTRGVRMAASLLALFCSHSVLCGGVSVVWWLLFGSGFGDFHLVFGCGHVPCGPISNLTIGDGLPTDYSDCFMIFMCL